MLILFFRINHKLADELIRRNYTNNIQEISGNPEIERRVSNQAACRLIYFTRLLLAIGSNVSSTGNPNSI